jgi:quercetin dioxygenase-like cupin family protein
LKPETAPPPDYPAEVELACAPLGPTLAFFVERLGFRIESIFPAEEPRVAVISGHGLRLRLAPGEGDPGRIRILCRGPPDERTLTAPNGARIEFVDADQPVDRPLFRAEFIVSRQSDGAPEVEGRAGMTYRDLIPNRLGGCYVASLISIPEGGPVADWTHWHRVGFQMIFCRRGWVRVVYEDQGPPFVLAAGDCVLQPPRIRHRVMESSPGLEVAEISAPALHETFADHDLVLPTKVVAPDRDFDGQVFLRHVAAETPWRADVCPGFERRETGMARATRGLADAFVLRPAGAGTYRPGARQSELLFGFLLEGACLLDSDGSRGLIAGDAFVIPPGEAWGLRECAPDLELLVVQTSSTNR